MNNSPNSRLFLLFLAPVGVFVGSATNSTITVAVKPPQVPGGVRRYKVSIGSKQCEAQVGPATPSCTLTGLGAGTQYSASARSVGDNYKVGLPAVGLVTTLPDGIIFVTTSENEYVYMRNHSSIFP